jgi:hypothetical protein
MHTSKFFLHLGATLSCAAGIANAAYTISDTYDSSNFFSDFTFFTQVSFSLFLITRQAKKILGRPYGWVCGVYIRSASKSN